MVEIMFNNATAIEIIELIIVTHWLLNQVHLQAGSSKTYTAQNILRNILGFSFSKHATLANLNDHAF